MSSMSSERCVISLVAITSWSSARSPRTTAKSQLSSAKKRSLVILQQAALFRAQLYQQHRRGQLECLPRSGEGMRPAVQSALQIALHGHGGRIGQYANGAAPHVFRHIGQ